MGDCKSQRERETETETGAEQTPAVASNYQVFLSFRGTDTRRGFTNVLYRDLDCAGICVFLDDKELHPGSTIGSSLELAINNSKIYIPVFSHNYASSRWCLDELKRIVENTLNSEGNKVILPIFLDVKPDDVKLKTPLYRNAIQKLKRRKRLSNEQVNDWRKALAEVDETKGWELEKYEGYGELSKVVVEEVVKKLKTKYRSVPRHFVRIDDRVSKMRNMLEIDSPDVRFIRIYGMGGIGKTTLANVVFSELSHHFGKCCFLDNVIAELSSNYGSVQLQKKLLLQIGVQAGTSTINDVDDGMKMIEQALCNKKVLIVLDNVDDGKQVEKLVGRSTLYSGSRILITSRNKDKWDTTYPISNYEMEVMSDDHALELFSKCAFNKDSPPPAYDHLSREIVSATGRLPLTLEVIGSLLHRNHSQNEWIETLMKLKIASFEDVFKRLMISYECLDLEQRKLFLDIACFFVGEDKMSAIYIWDSKFFPYTNINHLISKSLIKIMENNKFWMHDQLRSLGREIVRRENERYPEERSRLWICEEILDALGTNKTKEKVEALDLDLRKSDPEVVIRSEEIERFKCLKYLKLKGGVFTGNLANSLTDLSWISWSHPHPTSNPTSMHLKKVVVLQFSENDFIDDSKLQSLIVMASKLKVLSLNGCDKITRTPEFSECLKLESLNVDRCSNLREIDSSIGKLKCLIDMKIAYCPCLEFLPEEIGVLDKLKHFTVQRCDGVKRLPESIWKLKSLHEVHFSTGWDFYSANS